MSTFRGITANSMVEGYADNTVRLEGLPEGIVFEISTPDHPSGVLVTISLADAREVAAWLIGEAVDDAQGKGVIYGPGNPPPEDA